MSFRGHSPFYRSVILRTADTCFFVFPTCSLHPSKQDENGNTLCSTKPVQCLYIIGMIFFINAVHDFVMRSADVPVVSSSTLVIHHSADHSSQALSLPNFYKNACLLLFGAECVVMLMANALILLDACADPTNLQKCAAALNYFLLWLATCAVSHPV